MFSQAEGLFFLSLILIKQFSIISMACEIVKCFLTCLVGFRVFVVVVEGFGVCLL